MKKSRRLVLPGVGLLLVLTVATFYFCREKQSAYHLEIIKVEEGPGYGYTISRGIQRVVYQPFIPALPSKRAFSTAEEAAKVGRLVLERIENGDDFSITKEDLTFCLPSLN